MRARFWLGAVLLATVFAVYAYGRGTAAVGRPAPALSLTDAQGSILSLAALRGRPVLLDFWASWCTVCQQQEPALETFARRFQGEVHVLGVDWREPAPELAAWAKTFHLTYPNVRDGDGSVAQRYEVHGVPELWWLDARGVARLHVVGPSDFSQLQAQLAQVLGHALAPVAPLGGGDFAQALGVTPGRLWLGASGPTGGLWSRPLAGGAWRNSALRGGVFQLVSGQGQLLALGSGGWSRRGAAGKWSPWLTAAAGLPTAPAALAYDGTSWWAFAGGRLWSAPGLGGPFARSGRSAPLPGGAAPRSLTVADGWVALCTDRGTLLSANGGASWQLAAWQRPVLGASEFSSPMQELTGQVPLDPAQVALGGPTSWLLAGPGGLYAASAGGAAQRLGAAPARSFVAVVRAGARLKALAPDGDLYEALAPGGPWTREGAAA